MYAVAEALGYAFDGTHPQSVHSDHLLAKHQDYPDLRRPASLLLESASISPLASQPSQLHCHSTVIVSLIDARDV